MGEIKDPPVTTHPPDPPELPRAVQLYPGQWIGIPLLLLIPVLALLNVFGEARTERDAADGAFSLKVEYPERMRHGQHTSISIEVTNRSNQSLDEARVSLDSDYLDAFSGVSITPSPESAYEISLGPLPAGETRSIRIEMSGDERWQRRGTVTASAPGVEATTVPIQTFVFP